jgi:hypothetical protein
MDLININSRRFLHGAAATQALSALNDQVMGLVTPAKKWREALIGTGWYGKSDLFRLIQVALVEVVALCNVDKNQLTAAANLVSQRQKSGKTPRPYGDYKKLLAENKLDIVLIGSPDDWHALQAIDALKSGAHVYVQKPIGVDVMEGEAMQTGPLIVCDPVKREVVGDPEANRLVTPLPQPLTTSGSKNGITSARLISQHLNLISC